MIRFLLYFMIAMFFLPLTGCDTVRGVFGEGAALAVLEKAAETGGKVSDAMIENAHKALDKYCKAPKAGRMALRKALVTQNGNKLHAICVRDSTAAIEKGGPPVIVTGWLEPQGITP